MFVVVFGDGMFGVFGGGGGGCVNSCGMDFNLPVADNSFNAATSPRRFIGLQRNMSIPLSNAFERSSERAFAVRAMIGEVKP